MFRPLPAQQHHQQPKHYHLQLSSHPFPPYGSPARRSLPSPRSPSLSSPPLDLAAAWLAGWATPGFQVLREVRPCFQGVPTRASTTHSLFNLLTVEVFAGRDTTGIGRGAGWQAFSVMCGVGTVSTLLLGDRRGGDVARQYKWILGPRAEATKS
jgi:hypothetical protein